MEFITCPHCGTHVDEDAVRCPACHGSLIMPNRPPAQQGSWCPVCGVALEPGLSSCPSCGHPLPQPKPVQEQGGGVGGDDEAEMTQVLAHSRIEPALPAEPIGYDEPYDEDATSRTPRVFVAAIAALVFVGGLALAITHPWNPDAYSIKAKTEADTSKAGSPGEIDRLPSQDSAEPGEAPPEEEPLSADEVTHRALADAWGELAGIEARLAASEERVREVAENGADAQAVEDGAAELGSCAIELSNLIASVEALDVSTGTYAESAENVATLGNWLRNWADALDEAWAIAVDVGGYASADITGPLDEDVGQSGKNTYRSLFEQSYITWKPAAPST